MNYTPTGRLPRECHGNNKYLRQPENLLEFRIQNNPQTASLTRCRYQLARHSCLSVTEEQLNHKFKFLSPHFRHIYSSTTQVGQRILIVEVLRSHSDTLHSVRLLWTRDQPIAETFTWQHTTFTTDKHPCPHRDSNPQSQQASGRRPKPKTTRSLVAAYFWQDEVEIKRVNLFGVRHSENLCVVDISKPI